MIDKKKTATQIKNKFLIVPFLVANLILAGVVLISSSFPLLVPGGWGMIAARGAVLTGIALASMLFYKSYMIRNNIIRVVLSFVSLLFCLLVLGIGLGFLKSYT